MQQCYKSPFREVLNHLNELQQHKDKKVLAIAREGSDEKATAFLIEKVLKKSTCMAASLSTAKK